MPREKLEVASANREERNSSEDVMKQRAMTFDNQKEGDRALAVNIAGKLLSVIKSLMSEAPERSRILSFDNVGY